MNNKLLRCRPLNSRIQVFDSNGKFLTKWSIPEMGQTLGLEDLAIDAQTAGSTIQRHIELSARF